MSQQTDTDIPAQKPQLKRPVLVANSCNFAGIAVAVLIFVFPYSIVVTIISLLFTPIVFALYFRYADQLSILASQNTWRYPATLAIAVAFPILALFISAVSSYSLFSWLPVYIMASVLTAIPIVCFLRYARPRMPKRDFDRSFALTILCSAFYFIGAIPTADCRLDYHNPKPYYSTVLFANEESGYRYHAYYITVDNLGPVKGQHDVQVSARMYNNSFRGQSVLILVSPGLLHIPAYYLILGPVVKK